MDAARTLGQRSSDCPEVECYTTCEPCEHKNYVFEQSTPLSGAVPQFLAIVESVLDVHEAYIQCLCEYVADLCKRGELVNFPCLQCGLIDPTCIQIGDPVYNLQSCSDCVCFYPLDFSNCQEAFVDLSLPPYTQTFSDIIDALDKLSSGFANGCTAEEFLQEFLPGAELLFFADGTYHFSIGQVPTEILAILPLLANLAPIPLGAKLQYYVACIDPNDPFGLNPTVPETIKFSGATETGENTAEIDGIQVEVEGADALIVTAGGLEIAGFFGSTVNITFPNPTFVDTITFNNPGVTVDVQDFTPPFTMAEFPQNTGFNQDNETFQLTGTGIFTIGQIVTTISFTHAGSPGSALTIDCLSITN